jgi:hypothetical protein
MQRWYAEHAQWLTDSETEDEVDFNETWDPIRGVYMVDLTGEESDDSQADVETYMDEDSDVESAYECGICRHPEVDFFNCVQCNNSICDLCVGRMPLRVENGVADDRVFVEVGFTCPYCRMFCVSDRVN